LETEDRVHELVLAGDAEAAMGYAVVLRSLSDVAGGSCYRITMLMDRLGDADRELIQGVVDSHPQTFRGIRFVEVGSRVPDELANAGRFPRACYMRLYLADYVGSERALYVDNDLVFLQDPAPLFDFDLESHPVGAVRNLGQPCMAYHSVFPGWRELGYAADTPFLNAGVLMVDVDRWRKEDLGEEAVAWALAHPGYFSEDQSILNAILVDRWKPLPLQWNSQPTVYCDPPEAALFLDLAELERARDEPWIVHFAARRYKPWRADCDHPMTGLWRGIAQEMGWSGPKSEKRPLRRRIRRARRELFGRP
jgi:lipopolysaccharide biosynthesis glycosyltransferase